MQHRFVAGACALAFTALFATVDAQVTIVPRGAGEPIQMPMGRELKTGTARIKGRLVTADTGTPVRRAQVRISGPDILPKTATTDNEGNYEFRELPAGRFTITATKSGYVSVGYGQTRPFEAPKPVELRDGQVIDRADIVMPRGSVIAGRIVDEFGDPIADVSVTAMRSTWSNGRRRLQSTGRSAMTNDLGQYRIYGLPPGEYFVSATLRGTQEMMVTEMAVVAAVRNAPAPEAPRSGYAPTYFPGTPNGGEAQRIPLALGQEIQNADFGLVPVRLARVSGTVIGSDGRPLEGIMVSASPRTANETGFISLMGTSARTDRNGNFTMPGVAPGEYTFQARSTQVITTTSGDNTQVFTMTRTITSGPGGSESQSEFGSVPVTVTGEDLSNVMIVTSKGTTASGRVVWEGGSKPNVQNMRITAAPADADNPIAVGGASGVVSAEGTFELSGLAGPRIFRVLNIPTGWILKAIRVSGTDVTDTGVDIRPSEPLTGVEVVLTSRTNEVNGTVKAGNDPATDYTVVIFSEDPQKWTVPMTRHIMSARPNQEGRFQLKNLPAGSYYAIALDYIAQGDWNDPEVLDRLKSKASRFSLDEGEVQTLDLRLQSQQ